jgi:hypothetical protein
VGYAHRFLFETTKFTKATKENTKKTPVGWALAHAVPPQLFLSADHVMASVARQSADFRRFLAEKQQPPGPRPELPFFTTEDAEGHREDPGPQFHQMLFSTADERR